MFDAIIERAKEAGADLVLATDPDCDRIGCAAPLTFAEGAHVAHAHRQPDRRAAGRLRARELRRRPAGSRRSISSSKRSSRRSWSAASRDSYGVRTIGDLLVGFKWIAGAIDEFGPEHVRLRHRGIARLHGRQLRPRQGRGGGVDAGLRAGGQAEGARQTLHEKLDALFWQHGVHAERTAHVQMPGSEGMARMQEVMAAFRIEPPTAARRRPRRANPRLRAADVTHMPAASRRSRSPARRAIS